MEVIFDMEFNFTKKLTCLACTLALVTTSITPVPAEELETESPSAGATKVIAEYVNGAGSDSGIASMLPSEQTSPTQTGAATAGQTDINNKMKTVFSDIAIANVKGGDDSYVNVRKKANENSKIEGKIYNNCGAIIEETTKNGWYKIHSGNCKGYVKASFFKVGDEAISYALDSGYVFATMKGSGVHLREKASSESGVVTNVYKGDCKSVKKYSKDGKWVKLRVSEGVNGWVSADYVKISVDFDQAKTIAEEKAEIAAQKAAEEAARQAELEAQRQEEAERQAQAAAEANQNSGNNNSNSNSNYSNSNSNSNSSNRSNYTPRRSTPRRSTPRRSTPSYSDSSSGSGKGSSVVSFAKKFVGNPYVFGGSSLTHGTDCSGFTMSVYAHFGVSLNRTSYTQVNNGRAVSMSNLKPGDLLFYKYGGGTISHVAIYIGGGQIVHASNERTGITISGMGSPCAARRVL